MREGSPRANLKARSKVWLAYLIAGLAPCFWTFGRIACADLGLLDMWINRVLDAKSMKAMFGGLRI